MHITYIFHKFSLKLLLILIYLRSNLSWHLFNFLLKKAPNKTGETIYFQNLKIKENLIKAFYTIQKKNKKIINTDLDTLDKHILNKINVEGICKLDNFKIDNKIISQVNYHFDNANFFYDNHIPIPSYKKEKTEEPNGLYVSYDLSTQLNCSEILNICLNKKLISIAQEYIGSRPKLYSLNTFKTLPKETSLNNEYFTHDFHRDLDNLKWLVFFIFWTPTNENNGGFQQLKFSHNHSNKLDSLIKSNSNYKNSKIFIKKTTPGYNKGNEYKTLFKGNIYHAYGVPGTIVGTDTFGLHRGMPVNKPRLVTWIRFGNTVSRQSLDPSNTEFRNKAILEEKNQDILFKSKYKDILSEVVKY